MRRLLNELTPKGSRERSGLTNKVGRVHAECVRICLDGNLKTLSAGGITPWKTDCGDIRKIPTIGGVAACCRRHKNII